LRIIAGSVGEEKAPPPTPDSWAADPENEVAIWLINMEAGASWDLPPASPDVLRSMYFYRGQGIKVGGQEISSYKAIDIRPDQEIKLESGEGENFILLLQGKPINEPAVQYGPFVMNSEAEIQQAFEDYRRTEFGGWPWTEAAVAHDPAKGRFAKYADGKEETR
jgi:redox-sensitive bicupin YhaK (pirin superfamily)